VPRVSPASFAPTSRVVAVCVKGSVCRATLSTLSSSGMTCAGVLKVSLPDDLVNLCIGEPFGKEGCTDGPKGLTCQSGKCVRRMKSVGEHEIVVYKSHLYCTPSRWVVWRVRDRPRVLCQGPHLQTKGARK
jgi:hypothetical protein